MKILKPCSSLLAIALVGALLGCSTGSRKSANVSGSIRASLDQVGLKDVSVVHDRDKRLVTLGGHVAADADKLKAESIAKPIAGGEVVSNQIAVIPPSASELDKGIEGNLDAALVQDKLHQSVKYAVLNKVITLTGDVDSQSMRVLAQEAAASVPNVRQVVNELHVKEQMPSSSN